MKKETTATFIGHGREFYFNDKDRITENIESLIDLGVTDFLSGGMGNFDRFCEELIYSIKKQRDIKLHLVIPYLTFKIGNMRIYDSIIYPEGFEKYHFKSAIVQRNKYLVDNSAYAICWVNCDSGGAYTTFKRAIRNGLIIVNLGNLKIK